MDLFSIATDPLNSSTVYVLTDYPSVYKTTDGGMNWKPASYGLGSKFVFDLAINPADPSVLCAGTAHGLFIGRDGAASRSRVGGAPMTTWELYCGL